MIRMPRLWLRAIAIAALVMASVAGTRAVAAELGAFFVTSAVSAYEQGPHQGAKVSLRPHIAYAVVGVAWDASDRLWLRLRAPELPRMLRGEGWTPLSAAELSARGSGLVDVYSKPVEPGQTATVTPIPAADIQPGGLQAGAAAEASKAFPQITWRPVHYSARRPAQPWVATTQGTYRPGRSPAFVMGVYQELQQNRVAPEQQARLLAGIVRPGDSTQSARWAWGDPQRTWQEGPQAQRSVVWGYPEGQLRFEGDTVKDIR
jgi:hypothetical protein